MYLYRLAWSWYDDYEPYILVHEKRFDNNEWREIIGKAITRAVKKLLTTSEYIGMDTILRKTVDILCSEYGFRMAEYVQEFELEGSIIIKRDDQIEIKKLKEIIGQELVNTIIMHNESIDKELHYSRHNEMITNNGENK